MDHSRSTAALGWNQSGTLSRHSVALSSLNASRSNNIRIENSYVLIPVSALDGIGTDTGIHAVKPILLLTTIPVVLD